MDIRIAQCIQPVSPTYRNVSRRQRRHEAWVEPAACISNFVSRPIPEPGFFSADRVKVVSIRSEMMDTALMSPSVAVYNGRQEPLTHQAESVAKLLDFPRALVCASAGLDANQANRQACEKSALFVSPCVRTANRYK
ncbi:hypothetical protein [Paraburkholderia translucens]|uniref:hypothetical protein n=1 Tax=Paraburkholderia translucens TaxID=2886945 RepID=UPI003CE4E42E